MGSRHRAGSRFGCYVLLAAIRPHMARLTRSSVGSTAPWNVAPPLEPRVCTTVLSSLQAHPDHQGRCSDQLLIAAARLSLSNFNRPGKPGRFFLARSGCANSSMCLVDLHRRGDDGRPLWVGNWVRNWVRNSRSWGAGRGTTAGVTLCPTAWALNTSERSRKTFRPSSTSRLG